MTRPAKVIIDIASLQHNLSRVKQLAPGSRIMAIVKADAYGHGLVRVATALAEADAFGVACLEEAVLLRNAAIGGPIILLEGPYSPNELKQIQLLKLDCVIHDNSQLDMLEQADLAGQINVWLKIDTGMHRLGFAPETITRTWQRLQSCKVVSAKIRLMTHLATANEAENPMTAKQLQLFRQSCRDIVTERTAANSAGILLWQESHQDWVRPGLMLYGVSPVAGKISRDYDLKPAMSLVSQLIAVKTVKQGETVGYGANWQCPEDMLIGIVAAGYGDGFPRNASSGSPVLVNGIRTRIIGNASMDMLSVDLRPVPDAIVGDPVELWGRQLPVEEVADHAGTIPYELMCGVHKRLRFEEHGQIQHPL
jgi:alanine racemase